MTKFIKFEFLISKNVSVNTTLRSSTKSVCCSPQVRHPASVLTAVSTVMCEAMRPLRPRQRPCTHTIGHQIELVPDWLARWRSSVISRLTASLLGRASEAVHTDHQTDVSLETSSTRQVLWLFMSSSRPALCHEYINCLNISNGLKLKVNNQQKYQNMSNVRSNVSHGVTLLKYSDFPMFL